MVIAIQDPELRKVRRLSWQVVELDPYLPLSLYYWPPQEPGQNICHRERIDIPFILGGKICNIFI